MKLFLEDLSGNGTPSLYLVFIVFLMGLSFDFFCFSLFASLFMDHCCAKSLDSGLYGVLKALYKVQCCLFQDKLISKYKCCLSIGRISLEANINMGESFFMV